MKKTCTTLLSALALAFPVVVLAQSTSENTPDTGFKEIGTFLLKFITFINNVLVPLIFAVAFLVFLWGIFQYFVQGGANEEQREKGKQLMIWGFIGFFVMVSVWGIINLLVGSIDLENSAHPDLPTFGTKK